VVSAQLYRHDRVEWEPGSVHAEPPGGLRRAERVAHQGKDKGLGHALDRESAVRVAHRKGVAARAAYADAEKRGVDFRERGNVVGDLAAAFVAKALIGCLDQRADVILSGQVAGRDVAPLLGPDETSARVGHGVSLLDRARYPVRA
jgi:hypothetical protein